MRNRRKKHQRGHYKNRRKSRNKRKSNNLVLLYIHEEIPKEKEDIFVIRPNNHYAFCGIKEKEDKIFLILQFVIQIKIFIWTFNFFGKENLYLCPLEYEYKKICKNDILESSLDPKGVIKLDKGWKSFFQKQIPNYF